MLDGIYQEREVFHADVQVSREDIKYALKNDSETFIQFFLGDELTFPVPEFHKVIFQQMTDMNIGQYACAIPRDHAKTTLAKLAAVYYILFSPYRFIVYLSNTSSIAVSACQDIWQFIQSDNFRAVFGNVDIHIKREGDGLYKFTVHLEEVNPETGENEIFSKTCILRALGAGQQVRGINIDNQRPELAIVDDLEDNDNIATEDLFLKLKKWFYGPFRKALDKFNHKIIHLGNMISNRCLLKEHCESPYWHSMRYGCILSNGQPLWPDAWSLEKLREDFNEYLNAGMIDIWLAEMMNLPILAGRGLIAPDKICYQPIREPDEIEYGFITTDLAISDKTWAHQTAIAVHGWVGDNWQIVDYHTEKGMDPISLFEKIVELAFKWKINYAGIESVAYQASLKVVFEYMCIVQSIEGLYFVELTATARKVQRLAGWASMIRKKEYAINQGDFIITEQLLTFNPKSRENDDDLIDACAHGPQMIDGYLTEIQDKYELSKGPTVVNSAMAGAY